LKGACTVRRGESGNGLRHRARLLPNRRKTPSWRRGASTFASRDARARESTALMIGEMCEFLKRILAIVREALDVLEDGDQSKPCGRGSRLATGEEQLGELVTAVEATDFVGEAETEVAGGESGAGHAAGFVRDGVVELGVEGHGKLPRHEVLRCGSRGSARPALDLRKSRPERKMEFATSVTVGSTPRRPGSTVQNSVERKGTTAFPHIAV